MQYITITRFPNLKSTTLLLPGHALPREAEAPVANSHFPNSPAAIDCHPFLWLDGPLCTKHLEAIDQRAGHYVRQTLGRCGQVEKQDNPEMRRKPRSAKPPKGFQPAF